MEIIIHRDACKVKEEHGLSVKSEVVAFGLCRATKPLHLRGFLKLMFASKFKICVVISFCVFLHYVMFSLCENFHGVPGVQMVQYR
jgi:hypothetical protein